MAGTYQMALQEGRSSGKAGKIIPQQAGPGAPIQYKFVPNEGTGGTGGFNYSDLIADFQKREEDALAANRAAEAEIRGTYGGIIGQYEEGGAFREAMLDEIELTKGKEVGAATQANISGGLFGSTVQGSAATIAENRASRSRVKLEDMLQTRTNEAKLGLASFVERIDRPYPDYNLLVQAMIAQGKA
jgi:hypothetical protein